LGLDNEEIHYGAEIDNKYIKSLAATQADVKL
jgi:hypothetical protein